jgi:hypothetical protein
VKSARALFRRGFFIGGDWNWVSRLKEVAMGLEEITLAIFTTCNTLRIGAYVPQIVKAAADKNGASSISLTTWFLFLVAHLSTVAYALVNRSDWGLAAFFIGNAACSVAILAITYWKRRSHAKALVLS